MIPATYALERVPVAALTAFVGNPRTHSDGQIAQIAASIREFGWTNPILIDADNTIVAGHGRLEAARQLGMTEVPAIRLGPLTAAQRSALVIADNQLALNAGWDEAALSALLRDLDLQDYDLELLGFSSEDLERYLAGFDGENADYEAEEGALPQVPVQPVSRPGDLWLLGPHRLLCGNATEATDVERLMAGDLADLLWTDPPWNVNYGAVQKTNPMGYKPRTILNDHMAADQWSAFVSGFCRSFKVATKPGAPAYVVMSAQEWPAIDSGLRTAGFHWSSTLIWVKDRLVLSRKDYHTQYEPIWYGWNEAGSRLRPLEDRTQSDVWRCDRPSVSELHPTTKPVELITRALKNSSTPGNLVVDLFGGSGSTLIACEHTKRRASLMELDPKYVDVIVERWEQMTSKPAVLEREDRTYKDLKATRSLRAEASQAACVQ